MEDMYIEGYAIVYNVSTLLYEYENIKYYEIISPTALNGCDTSDVVLRYNHSDQVMAVASTKNDTLKLFNEPKGLRFQAKLANTTVGRDLYEMVKEKYLQKCSFAFIIGEDSFDVSTKTRTIEKITRLIDCSAVDMPAYPQTSIYILNDEQLRNQSGIEVERIKMSIRQKELEFERETLKGKLKQR